MDELQPETATSRRKDAPRRKIKRNTERSIQRIRFLVQLALLLLCIWIGIEFHLFVKYLESGGTTTWVARPPGAEGFLPISSLMSLYDFFLSGELHPAHPAGVFILIAVLAMSLLFAKSFCSWICPVGTISELLGDLGDKLFRRRIRLPRWLDYPLRSLKYLLLAFFLWAIFGALGATALRAFLDTPYNKVADIKMYYFFADISQFALVVIVALVLLSIPIRNFWCRYLCPYGALLGIFSFLSLHRIKRNPSTCIDCARCARVCPSSIKVDKVLTVVSDECTSCMQCLDACPVADTLELKGAVGGRVINKKLVGVGVIATFLLIAGAAMLTGQWQNNISREEYLYHQQYLKGYGHPTGFDDGQTDAGHDTGDGGGNDE